MWPLPPSTRAFSCSRSRVGAATLGLALVLVVLVPHAARAAVFTVNAVDDTSDGVCDAGHCSLREAITAAAQTVGGDEIDFELPGDPPFTIAVGSQLPSLAAGVTVDGSTQPGFAGTPVVVLDGGGAGFAHGLVSTGMATIRSLVITNFEGNGVLLAGAGGDVVEGCYVGIDASGMQAAGNARSGVNVGSSNNRIGGSDASQRNVLSGNTERGVVVTASAGTLTGNVIEGNYIGTDAAGTAAVPNGRAGIGLLFDANGNTIGGDANGAGNVLSGNARSGIELIGGGNVRPQLNVISGNRIGTSADGSAALPNGIDGVFLSNARENEVGGKTSTAANLISGNNGPGLRLADAVANVMEGNRIGVAADGVSALGNTGPGVLLGAGSTDNLVGGEVSTASNRIAFNSSGVKVEGTATANSILGNSIADNAGLGIELGSIGVTPNDSDDADSGANQLQNYPVLESASTGARPQIDGHFIGAPSAQLRVEFFANEHCDSSGYGEGGRFLGAAQITTGQDGTIGFQAMLFATIDVGEQITATATDLINGDTSEFSACVDAGAGAACADPTGDGKPTATDALIVLKAAVGGATCDPCLCDINGDAAITATDAFRVLRIAVGQDIPLECPAC